jgi:single-stranded-DNA-specific exonuclease
MRWTLKPKPSEDIVKHLFRINVEDFVATLLVQRGINTLTKLELFRPSLREFTRSILMKDMEKQCLVLNNDRKLKIFWFW